MPASAPALRQCILVVGMHRSGTSAITRTLHEMGAAVHGDLLGPGPENPEGFWESAEIVAIHNRFLAAVGSHWDDPRAFGPSVFDGAAASRCRAELLAILQREFEQARVFAIKDPRLCRLMPIWTRLLGEFGAQPIVVAPVRHPAEVALSLAKRNGLRREHALALWLVYSLSAERDTRGVSRSFVSYDGFVSDPEGSARELVRRIDCFKPDEVTAGLARIGAQWSPALRHHSVRDDVLGDDPATPAWVRQTYEWLREAARGEEPPGARLDDIAGKVREAQQLYDPLIAGLFPLPAPLRNFLERIKNRLSG